jgi:energy-coupling factor transporter ATP-binding protein EcfA2
VLDELERLGGDREAIARVLRRHRLETLAARAPWTLSRGERQRLVHAAVDLTRPTVLIVDEPAQGLDPEDLAAFVELVHRRAAKGRAYLLISHREELLAVAHRRLRLANGRLEEVAP